MSGSHCEHGWTARWKDGVRSHCRGFCCYHRNPKTHRRTRHSFCRVNLHGHEVLRMCAPRGMVLSLTELGDDVEAALQDLSPAEALTEEEAEEEGDEGD